FSPDLASKRPGSELHPINLLFYQIISVPLRELIADILIHCPQICSLLASPQFLIGATLAKKNVCIKPNITSVLIPIKSGSNVMIRVFI
ncbi:MAG: hypothetical protein KAI29_27260, partial [Cyclobacteriaceae bacterium]|nr:hypothetical protein [Cyclobacteriaceae bacterium]